MQGVGHVMTEEVLEDGATGACLSSRTWSYKPPGIAELPQVRDARCGSRAPACLLCHRCISVEPATVHARRQVGADKPLVRETLPPDRSSMSRSCTSHRCTLPPASTASLVPRAWASRPCSCRRPWPQRCRTRPWQLGRTSGSAAAAWRPLAARTACICQRPRTASSARCRRWLGRRASARCDDDESVCARVVSSSGVIQRMLRQ